MWRNFICICLVALAIRLSSTRAESCPFADDIAPCHCSQDPETGEVDLDCSSVLDDFQLERIFEARFPSSTFRRFEMKGSKDRSVPIVYLPDTLFGNLTFQMVIIRYTDISHIGENVFEQSHSTLERLTLSHSQLTTFPATSLPYFSQLSLLDLSYNKMVFLQDLHSGSLETVYLESNEGLAFAESFLAWVPSLLEMNMAFCGIESIPAGFFTAAEVLSNINLNGNKLTHLEATALTFSSDVSEIILSDNLISGADTGFISGALASAALMMLNNDLTDLPEEVWRPPLQYLSAVDGKGFIALDGNPFTCECNIGWLITSPDLLQYIARGAKCSDGTPIHDLDPIFFYDHCP